MIVNDCSAAVSVYVNMSDFIPSSGITHELFIFQYGDVLNVVVGSVLTLAGLYEIVQCNAFFREQNI